MTPLISIIIPTYNRAGALLRAIDSIFKQTYKNVEIIIIDDGSTDDTELILLNFIVTQKIKYYKTQNLGVSHARNLGAQYAQGIWLCFLDSDDEWLPKKLEMQLAFSSENPDHKIIYGNEIWIRNGIRVNPGKNHQKHGGYIFEQCIEKCFIAPSSVFILKIFFLKMNGFDETLKICEDYDLWIRISHLNKIGYIPTPIIVKYGGHVDQLSTMYFAMDMWRLKSLHKFILSQPLEANKKEFVLKVIKEKSDQLMKGYIKYNKSAEILMLKNILSDVGLD